MQTHDGRRLRAGEPVSVQDFAPRQAKRPGDVEPVTLTPEAQLRDLVRRGVVLESDDVPEATEPSTSC